MHTSGPDHDDTVITFRKKCVYEDLLLLCDEFSFTPDHVHSLFGGADGNMVPPAAPPVAPAATPSSSGARARLPVTPIVVGNNAHSRVSIPAGCSYVVKGVGGGDQGGLEFEPLGSGRKTAYQQYHCSWEGCLRRVRTYCVCESVAVGSHPTMYCDQHYTAHTLHCHTDE